MVAASIVAAGKENGLTGNRLVSWETISQEETVGRYANMREWSCQPVRFQEFERGFVTSRRTIYSTSERS